MVRLSGSGRAPLAAPVASISAFTRMFVRARAACARPAGPSYRRAAPAARRTAAVEVPRGVLSRRHADNMEQARAAVPKFVETSYYLARLVVATAQKNGPGKGRELLTEVQTRFPKSPSVTYLSGRFNQLIGDCRAALRYYDETIAIKKVHEDALLGRTMCLTFLKRTEEAIAAASVIIDGKLDNIALGYYWRAWNRHYTEGAGFARADIERAKALQARADIYLLAGMIEYDQKDLSTAKIDPGWRATWSPKAAPPCGTSASSTWISRSSRHPPSLSKPRWAATNGASFSASSR